MPSAPPAARAPALPVRDLTPGAVTVTFPVTQVVTGSRGTSRSSAAYAVTLTPDGASWSVWDIEPAAAGNS